MKLKPLSLKGYFVLAVAVIVIDQLTKWMVTRTLSGGREIVLIPHCLQLIYRTNTGVAFSLFQEHPMILAAFATTVAVAMAVWSWKLHPEELELRWPLGLILGGAVGNLTDRYWHGYVIDFIDAHWNERYHFPTFNVADSAICVGMGLLLLLSFTATRRN